MSFRRKLWRIDKILVNLCEPRINALRLMGGTPPEGAMIDILITSFVAAFITIALFGHVMVAKALITPDRTA